MCCASISTASARLTVGFKVSCKPLRKRAKSLARLGVLSISDYPYDMTMGRGANESTYTVRVYAGRASERSAAKLIADLMDPANPLNLKSCVEGDSNLLMLVDYARVRSAGDMNVVAIGTGDVLYVTVDFQVEVVVSN